MAGDKIIIARGEITPVIDYLEDCGFDYDEENNLCSAFYKDIDVDLLEWNKHHASAKMAKLFRKVEYLILKF